MARSLLRQRDKLVARAESVRASLADDVVAPLAREIAALEAELRVLSDAAGLLARHEGTERRASEVPAPRAAREAPVVFLHVPKTAGTTITIWLRLLLGDLYSKAASYSTEPDKVRSLAAALAQRPYSVEVVAGHLPYSTRRLFAPGARFFTFLRDPIERALSHFYYFRERAPNGGGDVQATGPSLEDALAAWDASSPASRALLPDNLQTRMLSGFDLEAPASRDMLDAARHHLHELDAVGLTERFQESMALLRHVFGWTLLAIPSRRVRTHRRPAADTLSPGALEGLRRLNALDLELYAEGTRVFEAAVTRAGSSIADDAAALDRARELSSVPAGTAPADRTPALDDRVARRADEIRADTRAALDDDLLEQAHALAMALVPHTSDVSGLVGAHLRRIAALTRELTGLVRKQQERM